MPPRSGASRAAEDDSVDQPASFLRLDDQLCFALYAATNAVIRSYRPLLADIGLSYPQYVVMMALWEQGELGLGDLAERVDLTISGLSPSVERLVRAGLLERRRAPSDRRSIQISLTEKGRALEQHAARVQLQVRCRTGLGSDELARLRTDLRALVARMDVGTEPDAPGPMPG